MMAQRLLKECDGVEGTAQRPRRSVRGLRGTAQRPPLYCNNKHICCADFFTGS